MRCTHNRLESVGDSTEATEIRYINSIRYICQFISLPVHTVFTTLHIPPYTHICQADHDTLQISEAQVTSAESAPGQGVQYGA